MIKIHRVLPVALAALVLAGCVTKPSTPEGVVAKCAELALSLIHISEPTRHG